RLGVAGASFGLGALCPAGAHAQHGGNPTGTQVTDAPQSIHTQDRVPCFGRHQAGIVTPRPSAGMIASFFVLAENRQDLERLFRILTERIVFLTNGGAQPDWDPKLPPAGSGILGPVVQPDALTVTVS